jgi:FixJ family two-component response regulator
MSRPEPIVYVVEDDDIGRSLISTLADSIGLACESFPTASEFLEHFDTTQCGCLILDNFMPGMSGLQLQTELNRRGAIIPLIFVTTNSHIPDAVAAMRQGAFNYLSKPFNTVELLTNLRRAIAYDQQNRLALAHWDDIRDRIASLSEDEREVLGLLARGCANTVMAEEMHLSELTVEAHRSRVMRKMGADSLAQLVRMYMDHQLRIKDKH